MPSIYIVRHGESTWNAEHRWAGHADVPLSDLGRQQALQACPDLIKLNFDCVASSCAIASQRDGPDYRVEPGFDRLQPSPRIQRTTLWPNQRPHFTRNRTAIPRLSGGMAQRGTRRNPRRRNSGRIDSHVKSGFARLHSCGHDRILLVSHEGIMPRCRFAAG